MQNRKKRVLPLIITILIMVFIFLQSALPADLSQEESNLIVRCQKVRALYGVPAAGREPSCDGARV